MKINAGIHFTKKNIRIVFVNSKLEITEILRDYNNPSRFYHLESYLLGKYPPRKVRFILDEKHFNSQIFAKILMGHGYCLDFFPPAIYYDPVFQLFMAVPKKTHYHKPFIKAAMLWIPCWKEKFRKIKSRKFDRRQLIFF